MTNQVDSFNALSLQQLNEKDALAETFTASIRPSRYYSSYIEAATSRSDSRKFGSDRWHRPTDGIDSTLAFVHYVACLPQNWAVEYTSSAEIGVIIDCNRRSRLRFLGSGLSFSVYEAQRPGKAVPGKVVPGKMTMESIKWNTEEPRLVAIKVPATRSQVSETREDGSWEATAIRAVAWELHVLTHHTIRQSENIIKILGYTWKNTPDGQNVIPALVLELADQGSLDDLLDFHEYCLCFSLKKKLCLDVAEGLALLHKALIIHGDLKTTNVLLSTGSDGELVAKLSDFGCAVHMLGPNENACLPGHSPPWDAPEASSESIPFKDLPKVDIYCWGLLLWRVMLDGRTPFDFHRLPTDSLDEGFQPFFDKINVDAKIEMAQSLKLEANDKFLKLVIGSVDRKGLDVKCLEDVLSISLRRDPSERVYNIETVIKILRSKLVSEDSLDRFILPFISKTILSQS